MLIVSVKTLELDKLALAQAVGEGLEIRVDFLDKITLWELSRARKNIHKPLIFTLRKTSQGGFFNSDERTWYEIIKSLCALEPDFVDIDYDIPPAYFDMLKERFPHISWIVSYHETVDRIEPEEAFKLLPKADIYKVVTKARSSLDSLKMLQFVNTQATAGTKIVGLCTHEAGTLTRVLSSVYGNYFNYCCLHEDEKTAEGQLCVSELVNIYHAKKTNRDTSVYALIGNPIDKSPSHITHNETFQTHHFNAIYVKIPLEKEETLAFFDYAKSLHFKGLSITMPLKEEVLLFLDEKDEVVEASRAVNTLLFENGKTLGFNTDGIAAIEILEKRALVADKKVLIIGAGGSARAIAYMAKKRGAHVFVINRTKEKAEKLAEDLSITVYNTDEKTDFDVIINCTPSSMPINEELIASGCLVLDIVHTRQASEFLIKAEKKGCTLIQGIEMFEKQAEYQFELWTKEKLAIQYPNSSMVSI